MTKEKLLKKARYFGGLVGNTFMVYDRLCILTQVIYDIDANIIAVHFNIIEKSPVGGFVISLPDGINELRHVSVVYKCKKRTFDTAADADKYLVRSTFSDEMIKRMRVYYCKKCGKWHFTSNGYSKIFKKYRHEIREAEKYDR